MSTKDAVIFSSEPELPEPPKANGQPESSPQELPSFVITEDGQRPYVRQHVNRPVLRAGTKVYLLRSGQYEGPYLIASNVPGGKCTLCDENGAMLDNGAEFLAARLKRA